MLIFIICYVLHQSKWLIFIIHLFYNHRSPSAFVFLDLGELQFPSLITLVCALPYYELLQIILVFALSCNEHI